MQEAHRVIKNTGFLYAKMGITMLVSLYTTRLILNTLGASDFGIFNIVGGVIAMLGFLNVAMASATQRFMSYVEGGGDKEKLKRIFNISFILHLGIALVMGIVLLIVGWLFFNGILNIAPARIYAAKVVYGSLIVSTVFTIVVVPYDAVLNTHENMFYYSIVGVVESFLKLSVALLALVYLVGDKLVLYGILIACVPLVTMLIMGVYCHRHYVECVISPKRYWDKGLMKEMTHFAGWNLLGSASGMISQYGLSIVLNNFFGTILNAAQGIANQISGQLMVFSNTMMKAVNPIIAKSEGGGDRKLMLNASLVGTKFSFLLLAFFSIPFLIETPYILGVWLKNVPAWTILFSRLQLSRSLIEQITVMFSATISAQGDIKAYTLIKSILNILPILITYVFFYFSFPPYYLYLTWIIAGGFLGGAVLLYYTKKKCGLRYRDYLKIVFIPSVGVSVAMLLVGLIPLLFMVSSLERLLFVCTVTTVTFVLSMFFIVLSKQEKALVLSLIVSIKNKNKRS